MAKTWKSMTAGILTMVSGCYGIAMGAWIAAWGGVMSPLAEVAGIYAIPSGAAIGLGTVTLISGIYALKGKAWGFALTGAIIAVPLFPIGTVVGILAIVFVSLAKKEFT
jgi:hypothetical protein